MKNKIIYMFIMIISLILIDQISKNVLQYYYKEPVKYGLITIEFIKNKGVAFGINQGNTKNIVITLLIICFILNYVKNQIKYIDEKTSFSLSLILAGGISNLIDRIIKGGVVDFISIKNFAIINVADFYIVFGLFLFIIFFIINIRKKEYLEEK